MMQQDHEWFVELIPAYAIGAADEDERSAVAAHLKTCAGCRALLADYEGLNNDLSFAAPLALARAGLTEDLRKRLNAPAAQPEPRGRWGFLRRPAFALGLAALALLILTNVYWASRVGALQRESNAIQALAQAPGVTLHVADTAGSEYDGHAADGVVYFQPDSAVALLCVYALPQLAPDKTYQAWLVQDGQRVSAGTFDVNQDGYGVLLIDASKPLSEFQQLGITVEPAGGSAAPTTPRVMGGEL